MDIDPDIGVCHPQGAVEAGHQQGQEGQTDTAHQLSPGDQGHTGQEIHSLKGGERDRVSEGENMLRAVMFRISQGNVKPKCPGQVFKK